MLTGSKKAIFFGATLVLILSACERSTLVRELRFLSLGTVVTVSLVPAPEVEIDIDTLGNAIEQQLAAFDTRWRSFGEGELGQINTALVDGICAPVSAPTRALIERAMSLRKQSNGAFDPTLGIEVEALGFQREDQTVRIPTQENASSSHQARPMLTFRNGEICSDKPTRIDLGGIAKGQIASAINKTLAEHHVNNALLSLGGDVLVAGQRDQRRWRIAIAHPRDGSVLASFEADSGESVFTSGDYERFALIEGKRVHHILDPKTGVSASASVAVTVIHYDPVLADAAATALFVAGPGEFTALARKLGVDQALLIDADLNIQVLPALQERLPDSFPKHLRPDHM